MNQGSDEKLVQITKNINLDQLPAKNDMPKKRYSVISSALRKKFIHKVLSKELTIPQAAKNFGIKFSTGKAILKTFKKEGRIGKKTTRNREKKNQEIKKDDPEKTHTVVEGLTFSDFGQFGKQFLICQQLVNTFFSNSKELPYENKINLMQAFINNLSMLVMQPNSNFIINNWIENQKALIFQQQQQQILIAQSQKQQAERNNSLNPLLLNLFLKNNLVSTNNGQTQ